MLDSTFTRPATLTSLSQLGPNTAIQVDIFNNGPSLSPGATLTITWPLRTTSGSYILYPSSVSVQRDHPHTFPSTHLCSLAHSPHSVSLSHAITLTLTLALHTHASSLFLISSLSAMFVQLTGSPSVSCSMEHIDPENFNSPSRKRRQAATGLEGVAIVGDVSLVSEEAVQRFKLLVTCTIHVRGRFLLSMCAPDISLHTFRIAMTLVSSAFQLFAPLDVCLRE